MDRHSSGSETDAYHLHDYGADLFDSLPGLLFDLSFRIAQRRWRRLRAIHRRRVGATALLCDPDHTPDLGFHNPALGDYYSDSSLTSAIRSPSANGPFYDADLALCLNHGGHRLFHVVPVVSIDPF